MSFEIEICRADAVHQRIVDLVGADRIRTHDDRIVVTVPDQTAAVGTVSAVHALGCDVRAIRRRR